VFNRTGLNMKSNIYKIRYPLLPTLLIVLFFITGCSNSNTDYAEVEQLLANISTYQYNQSLEPMVRLDSIIRQIENQNDVVEIENLMIEQLQKECSEDGKDQICRRLRIIGTEKSAPVLIEMLNNSADFEKSLFALENIEGSAVDELLYKEFSKRAGTQKIRLTNVMGLRSIEKSIPDLEKLVHVNEKIQAAAAVSALGQMPSEKVIKILLSNVDKTSGDIQLRLLNTVIQLSEKLQDSTRSKTILTNIFKKKYTVVTRLAALAQMIKIDTEYGTDLLLEAISSNNSKMRRGSLALIHLLPDGPKLNEIIANSNKLSADETLLLIHALSRKPGSNYSDFFLDCAKSKNDKIRFAGLSALRYAKTATVIPHLISVAASATGCERTITRESLYLINAPETDALLLKMLNESENQEKSEIIRCIGQRQIKESMMRLTQLATDHDKNINRSAVSAIKSLAEVQDIKLIADLLLKINDPVREKDLVATLQILVIQIDPPEQRATEILSIIKTVSDDEKKGQLMQVLGVSGNPQALPVLESAINGSNPGLKKNAIKSVSLWPNEAPADMLLTSAQNSKSKANRILAYRGYLEVLSRNINMSDQELLTRYKDAIIIAPNLMERKKVFSGLAQVENFAAAELVAQYLNDKYLKSEAEVALIQILWQTMESGDKEKSKKMVKALIDNTNNNDVRSEARELFESIN
jgi:HEAT repeat protein